MRQQSAPVKEADNDPESPGPDAQSERSSHTEMANLYKLSSVNLNGFSGDSTQRATNGATSQHAAQPSESNRDTDFDAEMAAEPSSSGQDAQDAPDFKDDTRVDITNTASVEDEIWHGDNLPPNWFSWRKLWMFTGPGILMSIGYLVRRYAKPQTKLAQAVQMVLRCCIWKHVITECMTRLHGHAY